METNIQLRFKLDNLEKIGFAANPQEEQLLDWVQTLRNNEIEVNANFTDELCRNTINNGHNLLRNKDIFSIDSSVIGPMARIIGQYLFRLLFGTTDFRNYLHKALEQEKELEIILEFDQSKAESRRIMNLPWELMFCPAGGAAEDRQDGFFVCQKAAIYRKYRTMEQKDSLDKREVWVSVAFLTKDAENLAEVHEKFRNLAAAVSLRNENLHFEFVNWNKDQNALNFLSKEDLGRIFLAGKNSTGLVPVNKIVHLVCDISLLQTEDDAGNPQYEKAFYFNKRLKETEPVGFTEVFRELFNKNILQDESLRLLVLQAWNDEKNYTYSGFEDIANRVTRKNDAAVISMPYLLNQKGADGKSAFFEALYDNLAASRTIKEVVRQIRNDIVPKFSYGFPLFYLNGKNEVLVLKENISRIPVDVNPVSVGAVSTVELRLKYLDEQERLLVEKKGMYETRKIIDTDSGRQFQLMKDIEQMADELAKIEEERKLYLAGSSRPKFSVANK
jgi:hypothetical protein